METDYISREAAIALLKKWADGYSYIETPTEDAINEFNAIPAADVRPVKRGEWEQQENETWVCSKCKSWIPDEQHFYARFCLHCGAKMKGVQNG